MPSVLRHTILVVAISIGAAGGNAAVMVSTSSTCSAPSSTPISDEAVSSGIANASATSDLECIFGGENTGFAQAAANGSITGSTHLDLVAMGVGSADTGFVLVPGRESAAQGALADMTIALNLVVIGGALNGVLAATASQCEMLAGAFGEFRVNGVPEQNLAGCTAGSQVFASYVRNVPFQISWFIHAQAFSTMAGEEDDVGRLTFDSFELLTTTADPNPDAALVLLDIPEPSSLLMTVSGSLASLALWPAFRRRW